MAPERAERHFFLQVEMQGNLAEVSIEPGNAGGTSVVFAEVDDDGRAKRKGTVWTASAHIITAVIGSGVLSLAWAVAQLGWIAGPASMIAFALVTYYTSCLLADCYRFPDPVTGKRNYSYMDTVGAYLNTRQVIICGLAQYSNLFGTAIGYTIAASTSMTAIQRSNCFHGKGHHGHCKFSNNPYMILFGVLEIFFSQIPNFHETWWLSFVAAAMSFTYSTIGLSLGIGKVAGLGYFRGSLTGVAVGKITGTEKIWRTFQALGDIAFAFSFSLVLLEIQDTLKSPPAENKTMKKATLLGVSTTTLFYMLCGCMGYAAFGDDAPGNLLTGFGFFNPFWMVDIANAAIVIHLVGAYQVFCQPLFAFVEGWSSRRWPNSTFVNRERELNVPRLMAGAGDEENKKKENMISMRVNLFRVVWRTAFVVATTVTAMVMPFFNDVVGLMGALAFWPLTVYYPVRMYVAQQGIPTWSPRWVAMQILSFVCLCVSIAAAAGSIVVFVQSLRTYRPFATP